MGIFVKILIMFFLPIWPIIILILDESFGCLKGSKATEAVKTLEMLYGRAQLIKVIAQAGIQPLSM